MLTTFETDENVLTALRAGAAGFLVEDTYLSDLLSAVRLDRVGESLLSESWPGE
jgi:DNA-binding NarL/FixJ family response regulator